MAKLRKSNRAAADSPGPGMLKLRIGAYPDLEAFKKHFQEEGTHRRAPALGFSLGSSPRVMPADEDARGVRPLHIKE